MFYMAQILIKNANNIKEIEKIEMKKRRDIERLITKSIIRLHISPIYLNRVLELYNIARNTHKFNYANDRILLAVCFYRLNLEKNCSFR